MLLWPGKNGLGSLFFEVIRASKLDQTFGSPDRLLPRVLSVVLDFFLCVVLRAILVIRTRAFPVAWRGRQLLRKTLCGPELLSAQTRLPLIFARKVNTNSTRILQKWTKTHAVTEK